jgi:hypothetical protein
MLAALPVFAILTMQHLEADVTADGGDYVVVPFDVPAGTVEIHVAHDDGSPAVILDWGVWSPEGFRGWGGGLTDDAVIGVDESSRGYLEGPITPGTWQLVIGKAKLDQGMGHYVVDVTCRDDATLVPLPRAAFDPVVLATGARWYAGDFHVHSEESGDASATLDEIATFARGRGLDFALISDHNTVSHLPRFAAAQAALDDLLFLRGAEITTYGGHANAIGLGAYVDHRVGLGGVGARTIAGDVVAQGGALLVNHPALALGESCIGCAWELPDTPWDQVDGIEVLTGPYELVINLFTPRALEMWDEQLDAGHRIAAVGGSDDHRGGAVMDPAESLLGSPTTLVYASELGEAAIMTGVREGRTVVKLRGPSDPMVELFVRRADGTLAMIGDTVEGVSEVVVTAHVTGGDGMELKLWRDGAVGDSAIVAGADWTGELAFAAIGGRERVRAELEAGGLRVVITSHIWIDGVAGGGAGGGCGCHSSAPGGAWPIALVVIGLARRRARGASRPRPPRTRR